MSAHEIWYYARDNGSAVGPMSRVELVKLMRERVVSAATLVWNNDSYEWRELRRSAIAESPNAASRAADLAAMPQWTVETELGLKTTQKPTPRAESASGKDKRERRAAIKHSRAQRQPQKRNPAPTSAVVGTPFDSRLAAKPAVAISNASTQRVGWAARRWCARVFDICTAGLLALAIVLEALHHLHPELGNALLAALDEPFLVAPAAMLAWIPFEALALSLFGTTPGKRLWGIAVGTEHGSRLGPISALQRSVSVVIRGLFFGIPPITLLTQGWAMVSYINQGQTSWDRASGAQLQFEPLNGGQIMTGIVLLVAAQIGVVNGASWRALVELVGDIARWL